MIMTLLFCMVKLVGFGSSSKEGTKLIDKKEGSIGVPSEASNSELDLESNSSCSSDGGESSSLPVVQVPVHVL